MRTLAEATGTKETTADDGAKASPAYGATSGRGRRAEAAEARERVRNLLSVADIKGCPTISDGLKIQFLRFFPLNTLLSVLVRTARRACRRRVADFG
jgi:hypothetical protein